MSDRRSLHLGNFSFFEGDGYMLFEHMCKRCCEGIVSKRLGSLYRSGRSPHWLKIKNPKAPAVKREAEEDWGEAVNTGTRTSHAAR
jgi:ATP-dependent DNA ligase